MGIPEFSILESNEDFGKNTLLIRTICDNLFSKGQISAVVLFLQASNSVFHEKNTFWNGFGHNFALVP